MKSTMCIASKKFYLYFRLIRLRTVRIDERQLDEEGVLAVAAVGDRSVQQHLQLKNVIKLNSQSVL